MPQGIKWEAQGVYVTLDGKIEIRQGEGGRRLTHREDSERFTLEPFSSRGKAVAWLDEQGLLPAEAPKAEEPKAEAKPAPTGGKPRNRGAARPPSDRRVPWERLRRPNAFRKAKAAPAAGRPPHGPRSPRWPRAASARRATALAPDLGAPVRTSLGVPKWMTAPLLELPSVFPYGLFGRDLEPDEFSRRYRHRLHRLTPRVLRELQELREGYGDLVLLCFEPPGRFCHQHVLAEFLAEQLREPVEEVMPDP
jgi:Protein of unknown function, DUF488